MMSRKKKKNNTNICIPTNIVGIQANQRKEYSFKTYSLINKKNIEHQLVRVGCCWKYLYEYMCSVAQLCPALCSPIDCRPPGSFVHGIHQGRILQQVATTSSRDLPSPGIELMSPALQAHSLPLSHQGSPWGQICPFTM